MSEENGIKIGFLMPDEVEQMWHLVEEGVEKACKYSNGTFVADNLRDMCMRQEALLWVIHRDGDIVAHLITEIVFYPSKQVLMVTTTGGKEFHRWRDEMMGMLIKYAEQLSITTIEAACRPGMTKWLEEIGWKKQRTIMGFDLWAEKAEAKHQHSKQ